MKMGRRKTLTLLAGLAAIVISAALLAIRAFNDDPDPDQHVDLNSFTTTGPAACPDTYPEPGVQPSPTRTGDLLPTGASTALLCAYSLNTNELTQTHTRADHADDIADYLNKLPAQADDERFCTLIGRDPYIIVIEYGERHALLHLDCELEFGGAVRQEYDLRRMLAFWDVQL